jgi:hypothetical protein
MLALSGCVALALLNVAGYVRHLDSGDQAGFALGTFFLVGWFLPIAAVMLMVGAVWVAPPQQESRLQRGIAMTALIAGAGFFLAYALWMAVTLWPSHPTGHGLRLSTATILAFSFNVFACALAVRLGSAPPPPWLSGILLVIPVIGIVPTAAFVLNGIRKEGLLVAHLPFMLGPTLVWVVALVSSAWLLHRRRTLARSEGSKLGVE